MISFGIPGRSFFVFRTRTFLISRLAPVFWNISSFNISARAYTPLPTVPAPRSAALITFLSPMVRISSIPGIAALVAADIRQSSLLFFHDRESWTFVFFQSDVIILHYVKKCK